jgi:hypothetical protein
MSTRLYQTFAAALLCGTVGLAGPSFAAGEKHPSALKHHAVVHHAVTHHALNAHLKHTAALRQQGSRSDNMASLNRNEHQITAQLNRASLANSPQAEMQTTMPVVASADTDDDSE